MRIANLMGVVLGFAAAAHGGVNEWTPTGPPGAAISSIRYLPGDGRVAIAVTKSAIYRSTDDGGSWTQIQRFATALEEERFCMVAVNPANGDQALVAADSLYRTTDRGLTWNVTPVAGLTGTALSPRCVAFANSGDIAWLGAATQGRMYRSANAGANWEARNGGLPQFANDPLSQILVDATDVDLAYALYGDQLMRTENGGTNWVPTLFQNDIVEVAASRHAAGVLLRSSAFVATPERSSDYADTWDPVVAPWLSTFRFSPSTVGRTIAFDGASVALAISEDDGLTWETQAPLPVLGPNDFSFDPDSDDRILMGAYSGALLSTDRGLTWEQRNAGLPEASVWSLHVRNATVFAVANDRAGLYKRNTVTGEWDAIGAGANEAIGPGAGLFAITTADAQSMILIRGRKVGRSFDGGATWAHIATLPDTSPSSLVWDPSTQLVGYVHINSQIHKTVDGGETWTPLAGSPGSGAFAVDPSDGQHLVGSNFLFSGGGSVLRSVDGGNSWTPTSMTTGGGRPVFKPGDASVIYAPCNTDGIYVSSDGGETWAPLGPLPAGFSASEVLVDEAATDILYAVDKRPSGTPSPRVARSVDAGATWESLEFVDSFGKDNVTAFAALPQGGGEVLASRSGSGLYQMSIAPDLRLTSTGNMTAGTAGNVVLTVSNDGEFTASAVQISAELPVATGSYTVSDTDTDCTVNGRQLECMATQLRPDATLSVNVGFTPSATGTWQATVEARESDSSTANNTRTVTVSAAPPANPPPSGGGGGGGGGGGRLDYLLLSLLALLLYRTPAFRRRFPSCASALRKH